jgi:hypothetical protein
MIRVRHILDPDLRRKVCEVLTDWRGFPGGNVPEWFELDDHDYVDVLQEIKRRESGLREGEELPTDHRD